ncbi:hypothetical protein R4P57_10890 [Rhodococcus sp. IEGM 1330]|nr:hypothetical protein [Rhodococcus sp. IEGM 1330]MDV8022228.1 hypothetical protein [Rhodococcus sp. IEGM 1330]
MFPDAQVSCAGVHAPVVHAPGSWIDKTNLVKPRFDRSLGDTEVLRKLLRALDPLRKRAFERNAWHEKATSEVVGRVFGMIKFVRAGSRGVQPVGVPVVEDVLVLVGKDEPLSDPCVLLVDLNDPLMAVPEAGSRERRRHVLDANVGEFADDLLGNRFCVDVAESQQVVGLQFGDAESFFDREASFRNDRSQLGDDGLLSVCLSYVVRH